MQTTCRRALIVLRGKGGKLGAYLSILKMLLAAKVYDNAFL